MKKTKHITAFYLETLVLICVFLAVVLILIRCMAAAEISRGEAGQLNDAVHLARNAAEAAAEARGPEDLIRLLPDARAGEDRLQLRYDEELKPDPEGVFLLSVTWGKNGEEGLIPYKITVENTETGREIYSLETAVYTGRDGA